MLVSHLLSRQRSRSRLHQLWAALLLLTLAACGGSDDDPAPQATVLSVLTSVAAEAAGSHCTTGGTSIAAGIDTNADGVLQGSEITSVQYVCNGATGATGAAGATGSTGATGNTGAAGVAGSNGFTTLVASRTEPAGANCTAGGLRIDAGLDVNRNSVLDSTEVSSTAYVCSGANGSAGSNGTNGTNGTNGNNGLNGLTSLIAVTSEPAGVHCTYGGNSVASGLDSNANGVLDSSEVTSRSYACNGAPGAAGTAGATGATGATGPAGASLTWVDVTGTSITAASNTGYLADNAAPVTITLPATPAIGDVVRVSGVGSGGWVLAQQAGQSVFTAGVGNTATGAVWTPREATRNWEAVASSSDGSKLVAVDLGGFIYTSTNAGLSWTPRDSARQWRGVASSADGSKLVAGDYGGLIYTSADSGVTWTPQASSSRAWYTFASSTDGTRLVAGSLDNGVYTSADSGVTWSHWNVPTSFIWAVASSADGNKLVASGAGTQIYTSTDGGASWTARESARTWLSLGSSADGNTLVAGDNGGRLYVSIDSGVTWVPRESVRAWNGLAVSNDGQRMTAVVYGGGLIYTSTDAGVTWTPRDSNRVWHAVTGSADGTRLLACVEGGQLYTSVASTSLGTGGSIGGQAYEAVEVQYLGNAMWSVLNYVGELVTR